MSYDWSTNFNVSELKLASGIRLKLSVYNKHDLSVLWNKDVEYITLDNGIRIINQSANLGMGHLLDDIWLSLPEDNYEILNIISGGVTSVNDYTIDKALSIRYKLANNTSLVFIRTKVSNSIYNVLGHAEEHIPELTNGMRTIQIIICDDLLTNYNDYDSIVSSNNVPLTGLANMSDINNAYTSDSVSNKYCWKGQYNGMHFGLTWYASENTFRLVYGAYSTYGTMWEMTSDPLSLIGSTFAPYTPNANYIQQYTVNFGGVSTRVDRLKELLNRAYSEPTNYTDPYASWGESTDEGGNGTDTDISDDIPIPNLPTDGVSTSGFISLYSPTLSQLKSLGSYLWSSDFIDNIKKLMNNPFEGIIGLIKIPTSVLVSGNTTCKIGNVDTGVTMRSVNRAYVDVNCGSIEISKKWGAYLDYSPYTNIEIYLPYIGNRQLDVDLVMGHTVSVKYRVEVSSGACLCMIAVDNSIRYQYSGNCGAPIPINASNWSNVYQSLISSATMIGGAMVGGASTPTLVGMALGGASNVARSNVHVEHGSTNIQGNVGWLGVQYPYIIITRPRQCLPSKQNKYVGYPNYTTVKLSELSGYTEVDTLYANNFSGTDTEYNELITILKGGVII